MPARDRVVELIRVPASQLKANARNWRKHPKKQKDALSAMFAEIGIAGAVIARRVGDELEIIDGHLRAETVGNQSIPVLVVDLDDNEAMALLATADPLAAMAEADPELLAALIAEIEAETEAVEALLNQIAEIESSPDEVTIETTSDEGSHGEEPPHLRIGTKINLILSDDEFNRLKALLDGHVERYATMNGFAAWLCDCCESAE